jgi:hypothetical protein
LATDFGEISDVYGSPKQKKSEKTRCDQPAVFSETAGIPQVLRENVAKTAEKNLEKRALLRQPI